MVTPPFLKAGDTVGIAAPGRKISMEDVNAAAGIISAWDMKIVRSTNLHSNAHGYLAGSDDERLHDFQEMLDDVEIKAIICARGGYGITRILDKIDFSSIVDNPKWIAGFSDITALHLRLDNLGITSIHSTMPIFFARPESSRSVDSLLATLTGRISEITSHANENNKHGMATGRMVGGNLSLIADSIGTSSDPDTNGKILVLEEIDEYSYKIDRMLMHLSRAGKLDNLAGLVIGHVTDIKEPELPFGETVAELVLAKVADKKYPVAFNFPTGHENPNLAWIHGSMMTLEVSENGARLHPVN